MALHSNFTFSANAQTTTVITTSKPPNSQRAFSYVDLTVFGKGSLCHYTHFKELKMETERLQDSMSCIVQKLPSDESREVRSL